MTMDQLQMLHNGFTLEYQTLNKISNTHFILSTLLSQIHFLITEWNLLYILKRKHNNQESDGLEQERISHIIKHKSNKNNNNNLDRRFNKLQYLSFKHWSGYNSLLKLKTNRLFIHSPSELLSIMMMMKFTLPTVSLILILIANYTWIVFQILLNTKIF